MEKCNRRRAALAYGVTVLACLGILTWFLQLWRVDLRIPLHYEADALWTGMLVRSVAEHGSYLHNPSIGVPGGLDHHDHPFGDALHFAALWLLSRISPEFGLVQNLYFLLSFPLTAVAALFVFRRCGYAYPASIVASLLYAFLPYHFNRGGAHLFLATYFTIPLTVLVMLWLCIGQGRGFSGEPAEARPGTPSVSLALSIGVCLLHSMAGFYYSVFAGFLLLVAGAMGALWQRRVRPLATAGLLVGVVILGMLANALPTLQYRAQHGRNPEAAHRMAFESELHGLKVAQLLLPAAGHRIPALAQARAAYDTQMPLISENGYASLGIIGSLGFLILLGCLVLPGAGKLPASVHSAACLNLASLLVATVGGFGALVAVLASPQIRALNRLSIYIAFFSLFALVACLEAWRQRVPHSLRSRLGFGVLLGSILVIGILDQTAPGTMSPDYGTLRARFERDAHFVQRVEAAVPPGTMIFQLPYVPFPEAEGPKGTELYGHLRPYLHSTQTRWSFGGMKGRKGDLWQRSLVEKPLPELVAALVEAGFRGICVDRKGYSDHGAALEAQLARITGDSPILSYDDELAFYRLASVARDPRLASSR